MTAFVRLSAAWNAYYWWRPGLNASATRASL